eukprot:snap_masked-scaffold_13-processed-gene-11.31-mRNA-1 protein AED:1.00 eAED:1.00 QI:0/0/0/0/1/1/2/0/76
MHSQIFKETVIQQMQRNRGTKCFSFLQAVKEVVLNFDEVLTDEKDVDIITKSLVSKNCELFIISLQLWIRILMSCS